MTAGTRVGLFMGAYFCSMALTAFMPLFYADRGISAEQIGQILGTATFLRILAGPGWGDITDRIGRRRPVLLVAGCLATSMALLFTLVDGFWLLLAVAAGQGIAASAINPLIDSLALALTRERRMEYGPVRAVGSATFMVSTAMAGWVFNLVGTWLVPLLIAAGYGLSTALGRLLPEAQAPPAAARAWTGLTLVRNPGFRLTVLGSGLIQGSHAAYYGFAALLWRSQGLSDTVIGLLLAEGIIVEILLFVRGRTVIERLGPAGLTACAAVAAVVRWGVTAMEPAVAVLAVIQLLHAATYAMQHLSAMMTLSACVPPERSATAQALHNALGFGVPNGLIVLLAGWLYANHGAWAFAAMAMIACPALLLVHPLARVMGRNA
jgi:PPP family 3-phenylpropionic acid transporter